MEIVQWSVAVALLGLSAWIAILNACVAWIGLRGRKSPPSSIPLIGGMFGVIGLWVMPGGVGRAWAWLPLVLDFGCLLLVCRVVIYSWLHRGAEG